SVDSESSHHRPQLPFRSCPACFLSTAVYMKRSEIFRKLRLAAAEEGCRGKYAADAGDSANGIISIPKRVSSQDTSVETGLDLPLEIAHLLLIDVLGYSKLLVNEKIAARVKSYPALFSGGGSNRLRVKAVGDAIATFLWAAAHRNLGHHLLYRRQARFDA